MSVQLVLGEAIRLYSYGLMSEASGRLGAGALQGLTNRAAFDSGRCAAARRSRYRCRCRLGLLRLGLRLGFLGLALGLGLLRDLALLFHLLFGKELSAHGDRKSVV